MHSQKMVHIEAYGSKETEIESEHYVVRTYLSSLSFKVHIITGGGLARLSLPACWEKLQR